MAEVLVRREYDPNTGITEEFWYEEVPGPSSDKIHIRRYQDVEGVLDLNKAQQNMDDHSGRKFSKDDGIFHAARIPFAIIEKWMREDGFNWFTASSAERRKKLNDRDYQHLRVRNAKL